MGTDKKIFYWPCNLLMQPTRTNNIINNESVSEMALL